MKTEFPRLVLLVAALVALTAALVALVFAALVFTAVFTKSSSYTSSGFSCVRPITKSQVFFFIGY